MFQSLVQKRYLSFSNESLNITILLLHNDLTEIIIAAI
jgi:hypothetical protein